MDETSNLRTSPVQSGIDALFYLMDGELRTCELPALSQADIAAIQSRISRRVLRWFVRRGLLDTDDARSLRDWHNDGGFSLDAAVRIPAWDRAGLERLLRSPRHAPRRGRMLRSSSSRMTIRSPNRSRRWNSISAFSGS